jgi:hypothetical protein
LQRLGVLKATFSASDSFEVGELEPLGIAPMEPSLFALGIGPIVRLGSNNVHVADYGNESKKRD